MACLWPWTAMSVNSEPTALGVPVEVELVFFEVANWTAWTVSLERSSE